MATRTDAAEDPATADEYLLHWSDRLPTFAVVGAWGAAVSALHFGGLAFDIYTRYWWWDVMTHSTSGFGVAAVFYALFPRLFRRNLTALVLVPLAVLLIGAGFEVYEYVFKDFWWNWSPDYYREDTILDLIMDLGGALAFSLLVKLLAATRGAGDPGRRPGDPT
jgi:hypothetical protein